MEKIFNVKYMDMLFDLKELLKSIGYGMMLFIYLANHEGYMIALMGGLSIVLIRSRDWI
jgi:hypothetical protein